MYIYYFTEMKTFLGIHVLYLSNEKNAVQGNFCQTVSANEDGDIVFMKVFSVLLRIRLPICQQYRINNAAIYSLNIKYYYK